MLDVSLNVPTELLLRELRKGESSHAVQECLRDLETLGYWGVNVADHILRTESDVAEHHVEADWSWRFTDPMVTLGYLAGLGTQLTLATRVLVLPYRPPAIVAHAAATVDSLSGGRLILGVAPGYDVEEFARLGIDRSERGRITDDYLQVITDLLSPPKVGARDGDVAGIEGARLHVEPVQSPRPPIWIGGNGRVALARAIRFGDAWTPTIYGYTWRNPTDGVDLMRNDLPGLLRWAQEECSKACRPEVGCVASSGPPLQICETPHHRGRRREDIQQFSGKGTADELLEEFHLFWRAGCDKFSVRLRGSSIAEFVDNAGMFASEVLSRIET